jgi:acyl-CoA oxidase
MASTSPALWDIPALRPLAPLVLAAWDDTWLTPAELLSIREALERSASVESNAREVLRAWLDPESPPSAAALRALEREVWRANAGEWYSPSASSAAMTPAQLELLRSLDARPPRTLSKDPQTQPEPADSSKWRALLDGETRDLRDATRKLLEEPEFRNLRDPDMRAYREQVFAWCRKLSKLPLFARLSTEDQPANVAAFVASFETIAYFDLSLVVKFGVQYGLFAEAIRNLGTAEHHALLPRIQRAELIGCFAMTERAHGSNVRSLQTVARYDTAAREFVIQSPSLAAGKEWIGNAALHARMAVVFAQLETRGEQYGVHAFIVPIRRDSGELMPGVRAEDCGHKMGLNGVDNGRLWFDDVRVPRTALLDRFGHVDEAGFYTSPIPSSGKRFFTMLGTLVGGRINVAAGALAASKVGVSIAVRYGMHRRQFPNAQGVETPILNYLSHRQRLLPGLAAAYAFSFAQQALLRRLTAAQNDAGLGREIGTLAAGLKALGTWQAIETLQSCRESCGGQGYLSANRIDALRTDADVFATFEGDNTVLLQLVAKDLLRARLRGLAQNPVRTIASAIATSIGSAISERNPLATRRTDPDSLTSLEFHAQAMRHRERSLAMSLSRRIQRRMSDGMNAQDAFEACQDHALALAKAYTEQFVYDAFAQAAQGDPILESLCALYGLERLVKDMAWFVEDGYVAAAKARAIRKQLNTLLGELAPHACALTDAFGIPETCLGPLADAEYLRASGLAPE